MPSKSLTAGEDIKIPLLILNKICPDIILANKRILKVNGRIIKLTNSIILIANIIFVGDDMGVNLAITFILPILCSQNLVALIPPTSPIPAVKPTVTLAPCVYIEIPKKFTSPRDRKIIKHSSRMCTADFKSNPLLLKQIKVLTFSSDEEVILLNLPEVEIFKIKQLTDKIKKQTILRPFFLPASKTKNKSPITFFRL